MSETVTLPRAIGSYSPTALTAAVAMIQQGKQLRESDRALGYELRYHGDPILSTPCERVGTNGLTDAFRRASLPPGLIAAMKRIMHEKKHGIDGVGIAANQCGASVCVIIAPVDGVETVMVNPRIVARSELTGRRNEGCLSVPKFETSIPRALWVAVEWEDEAFTTHFKRIGDNPLAPGHELTFANAAEMGAYVVRYQTLAKRQFEARCIQHEVDHLHGKSIVDGASRQQRRRAERLVAEAIGR